MASMSATDKTYMADMTAHHKAISETAKSYLASGPTSRNANLSTMARKTMTDSAAEMAKMGAMSGSMAGK